MSMPTTHALILSEALLTQLHERIIEATDAQDSQRVQEGIDALDRALSETPASSALFGRGVQRLRRWCRTLGLVPSSYCLADAVVLDSNRAYCSSALSDVYVGRFRGIKVAVKALRLHVDGQESVQKSFRNEVVTWKCLRHPNIVPFLGISDIFPVCVVSEWMSGGTISAFLAEYPEENRLKYIQQIIYGLEFMHALGVIHGDLKPANVLVGENSNVRLADFGMATVLFNSPTLATTDTGDGVGGTMRFMAPELHAESTPDSCGPKLGIPTDIYALAMTIWELFSGQPPFAHLRKDVHVMLKVLSGARPSKPSATTEIGFTDDVWDVIERGWAVEPSSRPLLSEFLDSMRSAHAPTHISRLAHKPALATGQVQLPAVVGSTTSTLVPAVPSEFHYSTYTCRRRALCIGINYTGTLHALLGCVKDARSVRSHLLRYHNFTDGEIMLLTDDADDPRAHPTRKNMLDAMRWLVRDASPDSSLFLHCLDGDEEDGPGLYEAIYPCDFKKAGYILDDDLHTILVRPLPVGCRLTALFDSRHSGSALELPYLYHSDGHFQVLHVSSHTRPLRLRESGANVVSFAGRKDSGTRANTAEGDFAVGAISYAFMCSMKDEPGQSYSGLLKSMRRILKDKYKQKPQLSSSHRIDTSLKFII